ncbi:MAG: pathogenicity-like protein [Stenotrophomonas sp.]
MRKIFSSQRVENAEGVAQILRDAGIEVRVTNGRSYHSKRRGQFSYTDKVNNENLPSVWVVHANDQPRAREILRDKRLLDTTRRDHPTAEYAFREAPAEAGNGRSWAWRIRIALLVVIAGVALVIMMRHRTAPTAAPAAPAAQAQPVQQQPSEDEFRVRIQSQPDAPQPAPAPAPAPAPEK